MMKSLTRLSAWVILAGILSLSPCAFAQGTNHHLSLIHISPRIEKPARFVSLTSRPDKILVFC